MGKSISGVILSLVVLLITIAALFAGAWYMVDSRFGDGTFSLVGSFVGGIVLAAALIFVAIHMTNAVHRTAGEDVVEMFAAGASIYKELAKGNSGVQVAQAKAALEDKKLETAIAKEQHKRKSRLESLRDTIDFRKKQEEEADVEALSWYEVSDFEDEDGVIEIS